MDKKDIKVRIFCNSFLVLFLIFFCLFQLEKKLAKVATQIKKSRRDKDAVKKEEKQLNEIKQLLETSGKKALCA